MSLPQGINLRLTEAYRSGQDTGNNWCYPSPASNNADYAQTTAQGNSVGWESGQAGGFTGRNRTTGGDVRLAGTGYNNDPPVAKFRIDLANGNYNFGIAVGDASYAQSGQKIELFDGAASLGVLFTGADTGAANSFIDATGAVYTAANFFTSWTLIPITITSGILRVAANDGASNATRIAHIYVEAAAAAAGQPGMRRFGGVPGMGQGQSFGRSW